MDSTSHPTSCRPVQSPILSQNNHNKIVSSTPHPARIRCLEPRQKSQESIDNGHLADTEWPESPVYKNVTSHLKPDKRVEQNAESPEDLGFEAVTKLEILEHPGKGIEQTHRRGDRPKRNRPEAIRSVKVSSTDNPAAGLEPVHELPNERACCPPGPSHRKHRRPVLREWKSWPAGY